MRALPLMLLFTTSCSLYGLQQARISHEFERAGLTEHLFTTGPTTLRYWVGGKGPPLLLLHGFGGDARFGWNPQRVLARDHRLIVPDLVWFGRSTSTAPPSIHEEERSMLALLDDLGVRRTDVAGISYGGLVTWLLVRDHPDRFERVVLVDTPGDVWTPTDESAMLKRLHARSAADVVIPRGPAGVRGLLDLAYHHPPYVPGFLLRDVYEHGFTSQVEQKRALLDELQGLDGHAAQLAWTKTPSTLVVWGRDDPLFPLPVGERLAREVRGRLVVIDDANHAPNLEHPAAFDAVVERFLHRPEGAVADAAAADSSADPPAADPSDPRGAGPASEAQPAAAPNDANAAPSFTFVSMPLSGDLLRAMVGVTWHAGCPVALEDLREVHLSFHGFDGAVHQGVLVVNNDAVPAVKSAFSAAFEAGFPMARMEPASHFGGDDEAIMAADDTSAFNCRPVTGGKGWSEHSYGRAIDVNPVENPYVRGHTVLPPSGRPHLRRDPSVPGLLTARSVLVKAFEARGWGWGGAWTALQDYQHLSADGR